MDAFSLPLSLEIVSSMGVVLNVEQIAAMQSSLPLLQANYKFTAVQFWGRIAGTSKDFLIAQGLSASAVKGKKMFFCQDGVSWAELKVPTPELMASVGKLPNYTPFTGDPGFQYKIPDPDAPADEEEAGEDEAFKGTQFTEEQRLSVAVGMIEMENAMVPAGALTEKVSGELIPNATFSGLSSAAATDLSSYCFLHKPMKKDVLAAAAPKPTELLKSVATAIPKGQWSCRMVPAFNAVSIRSLYWPGFFFYHIPNTTQHGYCYFGTGEKNVDIAFMLP